MYAYGPSRAVGQSSRRWGGEARQLLRLMSTSVKALIPPARQTTCDWLFPTCFLECSPRALLPPYTIAKALFSGLQRTQTRRYHSSKRHESSCKLCLGRHSIAWSLRRRPAPIGLPARSPHGKGNGVSTKPGRCDRGRGDPFDVIVLPEPSPDLFSAWRGPD